MVGLAPSAVAAQVFADDLGIATENTAKWWQNHLVHGEDFKASQLVTIDEASLAGALSMNRIKHLAERGGAKVLLVDDFAQLQSVDAGERCTAAFTGTRGRRALVESVAQFGTSEGCSRLDSTVGVSRCRAASLMIRYHLCRSAKDMHSKRSPESNSLYQRSYRCHAS